MRIFQLLLSGLLASFIPLGAPASAAVINVQSSCGTGNTACVTFGAVIPPSVRTYAFNAPSAGTALVEFHGSMVCTNTTTSKLIGFVVSGIGNKANTVPTANSAGGLRHGFVFPPEGEISFNLASSRVVAIPAAGLRRFHFNLTGALANGIQCSIYNAAFRVVFI